MRRRASVEATARVPSGAGIALAASTVIALLLASCGASPADVQALLSQAQEAGQLAPTVAGSTLDDARLQRAAKNAQSCIDDYTAVLRSLPQLVTALVGRGQCYLNGGGNGAAAAHDFSVAITLSPNNSVLYLDRAVADRVTGNLAAAISDYSTAALIPDAGPAVQLTAVNGLVAVGDIGAAETLYQRALQIDPQSATLRLGGVNIALASDQDSAADTALAAALGRAGNNAQTAQVLAQQCHVQLLRQEYATAIATCTRAVQASSDGSGALDDLSAAQLGSGNPSVALAEITASIEAFVANVGPYAQEAGVDGFGLANLYVQRAWIDVQLQRPADAVADFQRALASLPGPSPDARARIKADIATAKADA